jgi:hypothetical protein
MSNRTQEYINHGVQAIPPTTVQAMSFMGIQLNDWVLILSGALIVLQLIFLLRKEVYRPWKEKRDRANRT